MTNFEYALEKALGIEGGYVDDPKDSGGKTNWGVTEALARQYGYKGSMRRMSKKTALNIYKKAFWDKMNLDLINDKDIAAEVFEFGINAGTKVAVKTLQRAYNALNLDIISEDGILGKITAKKVNEYKYPKSLLKMQNIIQGMFYLGLSEGDANLVKNVKEHSMRPGSEKYKHFIRGWIDKRVEL